MDSKVPIWNYHNDEANAKTVGNALYFGSWYQNHSDMHHYTDLISILVGKLIQQELIIINLSLKDIFIPIIVEISV